MSIPNDRHSIKYQGSGTTAEKYYIPFPFDSISKIKVATIASDGTRTNKTVTTDYDIIATTSYSTSGDPVVDGVAAEHGWITWVGTSPTDIVHIFRDQSSVQDNDWTTIFATLEFERSLDVLTQCIGNRVSRRRSAPETWDAKNRPFKDLADPVSHDDAITNDILATMDITPSLTVPTASGDGKILVPTALLPTTPTIAWSNRIYAEPATPADTDEVLRATGTNNTFDWSSQLWLPPAPNDGLGYCVHVDANGDIEWSEVYEVPTGGSDDDIVSKGRGNAVGWRTPNEAPARTVAQGLDRFVMMDSSGNHAWSPRFAYGSFTETISNTGNSVLDQLHADITRTFQVAHGLVDDSGTAVVPDRVWLQFETVKGTLSIPTFTMRLEATDGSPEVGLDATNINGKYSLMNVNDGTLSSTVGKGSLDYTNLVIKIHFLVMVS